MVALETDHEVEYPEENHTAPQFTHRGNQLNEEEE